MKRTLRLACLFMLAFTCMALFAQDSPSIEDLTEGQAALIAEQAAVLDGAPRLDVGDNAFEPGQMAAGFIAWVEVAESGLYEIALSGPGALVLASFPTPDGRYDGTTAARRHGTAASLDQPISIGPVLLSPDHPYMVSISSASQTTVALRLLTPTAGPLVPENAKLLSLGDHLFEASGQFDLQIEPATTPLSIDVIAEPRADLRADLAGARFRPGGLYPWQIDEPQRLRIRTDVTKGTAGAKVLVRVTRSNKSVDETEPNSNLPDVMTPGQEWSGILLPEGDKDLLAFTIEVGGDFALGVETDREWPRFETRLSPADNRQTRIWAREPSGALIDERLRLNAGDYVLRLERTDSRPEAVPYRVSLSPGASPGPGREVEPNDSDALAMPLGDLLQIRGSAASDDVDFYSFSVPGEKAGHLWRIFAVDASRIELSGREGRIVRVDSKERRMRADSLALVPGDYTVEVRADGDYVLRVMDLGERPEGFEAEPNDSVTDGQRLTFGETVEGGFHVERDQDVYLFRQEAAGPIEITIVPAEDGVTDAKLFHGGDQRGRRIEFQPGADPMKFRSVLEAGDWAIEIRSLDANVMENYQLAVRRLPALASSEPDDGPLQAAKLPRNGDISGTVGGFDGADQVFVPLPQGSGAAAMFCERPDELDLGRWRLFNWSTEENLGDLNYGAKVLAYGPELGGAVRLELAGATDQAAYRCRFRFAPESAELPQPSAGDTLERGTAVRATLTAEQPRLAVPIQLSAGSVGIVGCRLLDGEPLPADGTLWDVDGIERVENAPLGDYRIIGGAPAAELELDGRNNESLPLDLTCSMIGVDDLRRPEDMGLAAEFRILASATSTLATDTSDDGTRPPGLEALIARPVPAAQASGKLPVQIEMTEMPELAGYASTGQTFTARVSLHNTSDRPLALSLSADVAADGWREVLQPETLSLAPGAREAVEVRIVAPPWISPVLRPTLAFTATADDDFAAQLAEIPVDALATPIDPVVYWQAPDALRGGLNVLHYGLGARLVQVDGISTDEKRQETERFLHDGLAPHIRGNYIQRDLVFRLAAPSELVGAMVQLRSTESPERWPPEVEFHVPGNGEDEWRRVAAGPLQSVHSPQYFVFDAPVASDRLRIAFPGYGSRHDQVAVQEIQAIAVPGAHPEGLSPINAAAPELGGHVVYASPNYVGSWNEAFLHAHPTGSNGGWRTSEKQREFVVGFHQNRAARLQSIAWLGDPKDGARVPHARVETSTESPAGPWTEIGRLPAPPEGELRSELALDEPTWARYLRFTLPMDPDHGFIGPDGIEALETPGSSVLALWEDDQPRAAFEAGLDRAPTAAVPPAGGADQASAVPIAFDQSIRSSVVIERNEDWWRLAVPAGLPQLLTLDFGDRAPPVATKLIATDGQPVPLEPEASGRRLEAILKPGGYFIRIHEPPRSVVISWDTSGSVAAYLPRTLAAVRTWARSLQPGRDTLQLLPFGPTGFLLDQWAESPDDVEPALRELPEEDSSNSEKAMQDAANALAKRDGARGIVIITDAETGMEPTLWPALRDAMPRVVSLSIDSNSRQNAAIMMDWAALNGGRFRRVIGALGLADGMDMANALFRSPKAYEMTATLAELVEPEGEATLVIAPSAAADAGPVGAVELILDASGSMLQRMEGRRRIDIAHDALERLVTEALPEGMPFAFRVFGLEVDACRTELVVPLGPLDREDAAEKISGVPAVNLARTAIADSLRATLDDLAGTAPPRVVVLVTDGEETCEGDPAEAIAELRESGLEARINIVGFAIDDAELAETFADWAEASGGTYFDAGSAAALETSIAEALKPRFEIVKIFLDGRTEAVGNVALGEALVVPAGRLRIMPASGAVGDGLSLEAAPNGNIKLEYQPASGLSPAASSPDDGESGDEP